MYLLPMTDEDKDALAKRFIEEACDRAARKGVRSEHMLRAMLDIFVGSRIHLGGASNNALRQELTEAAQRIRAWTGPANLGPPLGKGDN